MTNFKALEKSFYKQSELRGRKREIPVTSSGLPRTFSLSLECRAVGKYGIGNLS